MDGSLISDAFAPFNINVTTSYSGVFDDGIAHRQVIGNSNGAAVGHAGSLGVAWVNGYNSGGPQYKTGFTLANNFPGNPIADISERIVANAIEMGNTSAHEVGHTMGLGHYTSTPMRSAFLYVNDFGLNRERWGTGTNSSGLLQDDLATIASPTNTFGYRSDDHGNTRPAATVLGPAGTETETCSGEMARMASCIHLMCSGVVPQQPPTMLSRPARANSPRTAAMSSGVSS